jgi:AAA15 family ATPase/GTPase
MQMAHMLDIKITVKVSDLIDALMKNKESHIKEFEAATIEYFLQLHDKIFMLAESADLRFFRKDNYNVNLTPPVDATKMYDEYIAFLSMAQNATMEITPDEYKSIVADDWSWARQAKVTNSFYASSPFNG